MPASFNASYALLDNINSQTYAKSVNPVTLEFEDYKNKIAAIDGNVTANNIRTNAYFVYGKANEIFNGDRLYSSIIGTPIAVPILSMIQCGRSDNCRDLPENIYAPTGTIFDQLSNEAFRANGFVINELDNYTTTNINREFVSAYNPEKPSITKTRENRTQNGIENTTYNSQSTINTRVRVLTQPWLIYTPAKSLQRVFVDSVGTNCVAQYYNYFDIRFSPQGDWGGHGKRKSDGDVVGNFVVADDDLNKTSSKKMLGTRELNSGGRMDW